MANRRLLAIRHSSFKGEAVVPLRMFVPDFLSNTPPRFRVRTCLMRGLTFCLALLALNLTGCNLLDVDGSRSASSSDPRMSSSNGGNGSVGGSSSQYSYSSAPANTNAAVSEPTGAPTRSAGAGSMLVSYKEREYTYQFPVEVSYLSPFNGDIDNITKVSVALFSVESDHVFAGMYLGGGAVNLHNGSLPDNGVRDPWMFELGASVRCYLTKANTFLSPYFSARAYFQSIQWQYRNTIVSGSDEIDNDGIGGGGAYAGLGIAVMRSHPLSFYAEAGVGGSLFAQKSYQGFGNDVFDEYGYFMATAGMTFKF
jgi:hypothetical protein